MLSDLLHALGPIEFESLDEESLLIVGPRVLDLLGPLIMGEGLLLLLLLLVLGVVMQRQEMLLGRCQ